MLLTPCLLKLPENLNNNSKQMFVDIDYIEAAHFKYLSPSSSQPLLSYKDRYFSLQPHRPQRILFILPRCNCPQQLHVSLKPQIMKIGAI
jgi:hypothetical protein